MNHKQKLGYMALGAGILAVGITIGQFVTSDIGAQHNGVFDKLVCRELEVVDKDGKSAIVLGGNDIANSVVVYNPHLDRPGIQLFSSKVINSIDVFDQSGVPGMAVSLESMDGAVNSVSVNNQRGDTVVRLLSREGTNDVNGLQIMDNQRKEVIILESTSFLNRVSVHSKRTGLVTGLGD